MAQGDTSPDDAAPVDPAEQQRLTKQLGRLLVRAAGTGWQRIWAQYRSAGRHVEADLLVTGADGAERPVRPPMEAIEAFGKLRQTMYRPQQGTWLAATYTVEPSGDYAVDFDADGEPRWRRVPPPIGFADELRWFPRAEESIPDWLRQRATPSGQPTPQHGIPAQPAAQAGRPGQQSVQQPPVQQPPAPS